MVFPRFPSYFISCPIVILICMIYRSKIDLQAKDPTFATKTPTPKEKDPPVDRSKLALTIHRV